MRPARPITLLLTLALTAPAWSQEQPPHHRRHHHHHTAPARTAPPPAQAAAKPDPTAPTPAPVPNANVNAPQQTPPEGRPSIEPGNVQLHLPESGDGFLPGSTADHGDNERAPVVPGVSIVVPLGQAPPAQ
jgi:hypothetical protein